MAKPKAKKAANPAARKKTQSRRKPSRIQSNEDLYDMLPILMDAVAYLSASRLKQRKRRSQVGKLRPKQAQAQGCTRAKPEPEPGSETTMRQEPVVAGTRRIKALARPRKTVTKPRIKPRTKSKRKPQTKPPRRKRHICKPPEPTYIQSSSIASVATQAPNQRMTNSQAFLSSIYATAHAVGPATTSTQQLQVDISAPSGGSVSASVFDLMQTFSRADSHTILDVPQAGDFNQMLQSMEIWMELEQDSRQLTQASSSGQLPETGSSCSSLVERESSPIWTLRDVDSQTDLASLGFD